MDQLTGRIVAWDRQKRYGYVEVGQQRLFLHIRDFAEVHKAPEIGDEITFIVGADAKGRTCAKQAVHRSDGGRLRPVHFLVLAALLVVPGIATWRLLGAADFGYAVGGCVFASGVTYFVYADDKHRARNGAWRAPEKFLHLFELAGGWPGAFLAQRRLRHKCAKVSYQLIFWLIVGIHQFVAIDYLNDWRFSHNAAAAVKGLAQNANGRS